MKPHVHPRISLIFANVIASVFCEAILNVRIGDCFVAKPAPRNDSDVREIRGQYSLAVQPSRRGVEASAGYVHASSTKPAKASTPKYLALIALLLLLAACTSQPITPTATPTQLAIPTFTPFVPSPTPIPATPTRAPSPTALPIAPTAIPISSAQAALWTKWQSSPHGNTYDLGKGPNTFCSRCHSPQNWDPAAKPDAPPNCVSCKFDTDATVRIAKSNPLVAQADWRNIGCEVCHRVENGMASAQVAWFDKATAKYESVANAAALCEKCHTDTDVLRHRRDLGKAAHVGLQCTQCHDAHTTKASCTASQCHANVSKVAGHDAAHANVSCTACHDATALSVGPENKTKIWTTWRTTEVNGRKTTAGYVSHNLQKPVDCARCHFAKNPWNLSDSVRKTP